MIRASTSPIDLEMRYSTVAWTVRMPVETAVTSARRGHRGDGDRATYVPTGRVAVCQLGRIETLRVETIRDATVTKDEDLAAVGGGRGFVSHHEDEDPPSVGEVVQELPE